MKEDPALWVIFCSKSPAVLSFVGSVSVLKVNVVTHLVYRTNHSFTNYKRFTGDAKVIATEGAPK